MSKIKRLTKAALEKHDFESTCQLEEVANALLAACQRMKTQLDMDEPDDWSGARADLNAAIKYATESP
jgi:hypothetical protein